jgi:hypothetical protein
MSEKTPPHAAEPYPGAAAASAIAEFWAQCFAQSNDQARALLEAMRSFGEPQEMYRRWLDAVSQTLDEFMRTPAFLEAMSRQLKMMTDLKVAQDQVVQDAARYVGAPLAGDITGLFERLNGTERALQAQLRAIQERLDRIEGVPPAAANGRAKRAEAEAEPEAKPKAAAKKPARVRLTPPRRTRR